MRSPHDTPYLQASMADVLPNRKVIERVQSFHSELRALGCTVMCLHDEWIIEAPDDKVEQVQALKDEHLSEVLADIIHKSLEGVVPLFPVLVPTYEEPWDGFPAAQNKKVNRMGYCIDVENVSFMIKKENVKQALKALKAMGGEKHKKAMGGVSYAHGKPEVRSYSWCDMQGLADAKTLTDALHAIRWQPEFRNENPEDDVTNIIFLGSKLGQDELLLSSIAEFVENGSFIEMRGEDGSRWRWVFENGKLKEQTGKVTWE